MVPQMGQISTQVRRALVGNGQLLTEPSVYSVVPSNTLAYTMEKLLASKPYSSHSAATLTFYSKCASTVCDGR